MKVGDWLMHPKEDWSLVDASQGRLVIGGVNLWHVEHVSLSLVGTNPYIAAWASCKGDALGSSHHAMNLRDPNGRHHP